MKGMKNFGGSMKIINYEGYMDIGGIEQYVTIKGQDIKNPFLFIIHGGPASPYDEFNNKIQSWQENFNIVQWDQRGTSKTYRKNKKLPESLDQLADDGLDLAHILKSQFEAEKIILVGSSVGSITANLMIQKEESLFAAYVATDQNYIDSDILALHEVKKRKLNKKNQTFVDSLPEDSSMWSTKDMDKFNRINTQTTPEGPNMISDLIMPNLLKYYSPINVIYTFIGMSKSGKNLGGQIKDFSRYFKEIDIPFFMFQGAVDEITPVASAKEYFDLVRGDKTFRLISNAGHLAMFANVDEFYKYLLEDVLVSIKKENL